MNRRRFLQFTIALAATAPIARVLLANEAVAGATLTIAPEPPLGAVWVPTQAEVDEWLEYYKICVREGCEKFADIMKTVYYHETDDGVLTASGPEVDLHDQAERAFNALHSDRMAVAFSQGQGYSAGRDGLPRHNVAYKAPSNEGFGWFNMWAVGDRDRRGIRLPRSPGVTWPDRERPIYRNDYFGRLK